MSALTFAEIRALQADSDPAIAECALAAVAARVAVVAALAIVAAGTLDEAEAHRRERDVVSRRATMRHHHTTLERLVLARNGGG